LAYRGSEISQGSETSGYGTERGDSQREREMVTTGFQGRYTTDSVDGQGNQVNRGSTSHWRENSEGQDSVNLGLRSPRGGGSGSPAGGIYSADNKSVLESETSQVSETNGYGTERGDSQREGETATTGFQGSYTSDSIAGRSTQVSQGSTSHWRENSEGQGSTNTGSDDREKGGYRMPVGGGGGTLKTDTAGQGRNDQNARRHDHGAYADPAIMEQVADRHGMTVPRFHNLPPASKQEMFDEYLSEMETVKSAKTRQSDTFAGETLSAHAGKLADRTLAQRRTLNEEEEGNVRDRQDAKAAATGAGAIGPLGIDTSMPSHVDEARGKADADYANNESGTVVYHNTSPDRPVDAGLRSELGVAHESASNDAKDGVATATIKVEDTAESAVDTVKSGSSGDKK
jgi:hypothetical protein